MRSATGNWRLAIVLPVLCALCAVGPLLPGCGNVPPGVQSALFTAESALAATVDEAAAAKVAPWAEPPGETAEERVFRLEAALSLCLDTMAQAGRNIREVSDHFDADRTTPIDGEDGAQ